MEYLKKWTKTALIVLTFVASIAVTKHKFDYQQAQLDQTKLEMRQTRDLLDQISHNTDTLLQQMKRLEETHPYSGKRWKSRKTGLCTTGNFFGFLLYTPVDTAVSKELIYTLRTYPGPTARINSLRRHYNPTSQHYHGKAVDLEWNEEVIAFLISDEGKQWLQTHGVTFYIEGRPGSKKVRKYLNVPVASEYVFFNPDASGDHIHLNI